MTTAGRAARTGRPPARERILAAAACAFGQHGYQASTLEDIAEAAGVARRTLYHHFSSKQEILAAATLEQARGFLAQLREAVPPQEDFAGYLVDCLCYVIREAPHSRLFMLHGAQGAGLESAALYFSHPALTREWLEFLRTPCERARQQGQLPAGMKLEALGSGFGRIAMSFLQFPARGELRPAIEPFVRGALAWGR